MTRRTLCALPLFGAGGLRAADWPNWRGPSSDGVANEKSLPLKWSRTEGVRWKVPLGERGNSTPVVWGDRIFLTQPVEKEKRRTLMCLDRASGKTIWQIGVEYSAADRTHPTNPQCSSSPVTDGKRVFAWMGSAGFIACDMNGKQLWRRELGKQDHVWGYGSSPILHNGLVTLNFGPGDPAFLVTMDAATGKTEWKVELPTRLPAEDVAKAGELPKRSDGAVRSDFFGSWTTPYIVRVRNRDEMVCNLARRVAAFDPKTGRELWTCGGFADLAYGSPAPGSDEKGPLVVSLGGFGGPGLAVRCGGSGDVTESHRLWHVPRTPARIGTAVVHEGHIYCVGINGVAECLELSSGKPVWTQRLAGAQGNNAIWSSPLRNGDRIYVMNQSSDTFVYRASPRFELLATNPLEEDSNSSVIASRGEIFLRSHSSLWCIG
jgi:outer membrane protein assembly factor BamB